MNAFSHYPNRLITGIFIFILVCGSGIVAWYALSTNPDDSVSRDESNFPIGRQSVAPKT